MPPRKPDPKPLTTISAKAKVKSNAKTTKSPTRAESKRVSKAAPNADFKPSEGVVIATEASRVGGRDKDKQSPPAPRVFRNLVLSESWMLPWADAAVASGSAAAACVEVGVSIADFAAARGCDPAFDNLCRLYGEVVDLKIMDALCSGAIKGEARLMSLYYGRVRDLLLPTNTGPADTILSASVAEAMIRAGLAIQDSAPAQTSPRPKRKSAGPHREVLDDE